VILVGDGEQVQVGYPLLDDVSVRGRIVEQGRHRKIIVFKHKRRKGFNPQEAGAPAVLHCSPDSEHREGLRGAISG